jgi:hypothetical protein
MSDSESEIEGRSVAPGLGRRMREEMAGFRHVLYLTLFTCLLGLAAIINTVWNSRAAVLEAGGSSVVSLPAHIL